MFPDVKTQLTDSRLEGFTEPSMLAIQRSREAAQRLWEEIGRTLAGNPFAQTSSLGR